MADAELIAAFERIEAARGATTLTFFEYNTLAALLIFAARAVDVAVLEVGLGGRLDATNLVDADVAVLASVGFDHRDWLGDTLELIGAEKAGIFRAGRPAVLGTPDMPASVFARLDALGAQRWWRSATSAGGCTPTAGTTTGSSTSLRDLPPSALAGSIQYRNAATAIAAVAALAGGAAPPPSARAQPSPPWRPRCARCASPAASRSCPGRWNGSWTSRTTSPRRACWRRSCASGHCRWRGPTPAGAPAPSR